MYLKKKAPWRNTRNFTIFQQHVVRPNLIENDISFKLQKMKYLGRLTMPAEATRDTVKQKCDFIMCNRNSMRVDISFALQWEEYHKISYHLPPNKFQRLKLKKKNDTMKESCDMIWWTAVLCTLPVAGSQVRNLISQHFVLFSFGCSDISKFILLLAG